MLPSFRPLQPSLLVWHSPLALHLELEPGMELKLKLKLGWRMEYQLQALWLGRRRGRGRERVRSARLLVVVPGRLVALQSVLVRGSNRQVEGEAESKR